MDAPNLEPTTWTEYCSWTTDERFEIIDGKPYALSAPRVAHQSVLGELYAELRTHFKNRACHPFLSLIDVRLSEYDVVQPDIIVVCKSEIILETHIDGPPTLAIEILSPSTLQHDRVRKLRLYAKAGVEEYWLIQPYPALVEVLTLTGDNYQIASTYTEKDTLTSPAFPDLEIPLLDIFSSVQVDPIDQVKESPPPYSSSPSLN